MINKNLTVVFFVFCLISQTNLLFSQKRDLQPSDYPQWETFTKVESSMDGASIFYCLRKADGSGAYFLKNTVNNSSLTVDVDDSTFVTHSDDYKWLITGGRYGKIIRPSLINVINGNRLTIDSPFRAQFSNNSKSLILYRHMGRSPLFDIKILDLASLNYHRYSAIKEFTLSPKKDKISLITQKDSLESVSVVDIDTYKERQIIRNSKKAFEHLNWEIESRGIGFFEHDGENISINYCTLDKPELRILNFSPEQITGPLKLYNITPNEQIIISKDAQKIFFCMAKNEFTKDHKLKQSSYQTIWHNWDAYDDNTTNAILTKPDDISDNYVLCSWNLQDNQFVKILEKGHTNKYSGKLFGFNPNNKHLLFHDEERYRPYFRTRYTDISSVDVETGVTRLILKKWNTTSVDGFAFENLCSPDGRYFAYFSQMNWWVYDLDEKKSYNISKNLNINWVSSFYLKNEARLEPFGSLWAIDSKKLLLYDQFDIWEFDTSSFKLKRLTRGYIKKITYRIALTESQLIPDVNKTLLLTTFNNQTKTNGISELQSDKQLVPVMTGSFKFDNFSQASKPGSYFYIKQDFNFPPSLIYDKNRGEVPIVIHQSNPQHNQYYWGKSELLNYKSKDGRELQGVLYYPANYDPLKKYPMIVNIYELRTQELHDYIIPTDKISYEANRTNYTTKGYFIFEPDIVNNRYNEPGACALTCVTAGVDAVIRSGRVNPDKIGLIGHSFGGYEANFIATHSKIFATIVSEAGISDLFVMNGMGDYRVETGQFRFEKSIGIDVKAGLKNSPLYAVHRIAAPLLLMTGDNDTNVPPIQSDLMFYSLRRLNKQVAYLRYKNEGHVLYNEQNMRDYFIKQNQWFDFFLKNKAPASWIIDGRNQAQSTNTH